MPHPTEEWTGLFTCFTNLGDYLRFAILKDSVYLPNPDDDRDRRKDHDQKGEQETAPEEKDVVVPMLWQPPGWRTTKIIADFSNGYSVDYKSIFKIA